MLTPEEQASFPRDFTAVYVLLWHKLSVGNEVYSTSEFGLDNDRTLDLRARESFAGFNLWTEFAARRLRAPMLRWLPLLGLLAAGYLALRLRRGISSPVMRLGMLHGGTPSFALGGHRRHG